MELLVLFPLTGFILFWQRWQQSSVASAALHIVCAIIVTLFAAGLLGVLPAVRWLLLLLGLVILILEVAKHRQDSLESLRSVPMVVFVVLCVGYFLVHGNSEFRFYDEFSHWGIYLKDVIANGGFWGADTNSMHPRYPPGSTLWQFFFVFDEARLEGAAYFGQFLLLLAPLLVLFESLKWRQAGWAVGIVVLILFAYGNFGHGIASLYIDHVIGAFLAGIFLNFLADLRTRSTMAMLSYALPLTAMTLIKDSCFFFALALGLMFFVMLVIRGLRDNGPPFGKSLTAALPVLLAFLAGPILVTAVWSLERDAIGAERDVMSVTGLVGILTGKTKVDDPERAIAVRALFPYVFLNQQLSKNRISDLENAFTTPSMPRFKDSFRFTTASFLVLFAIWSVLVTWTVIHPPDRLIWAVGYAGLLGIALSYTLMLYLSYHYVFPRHDALSIASYIRYVHSFTLPMLLAALAPLLPVFAQPHASEAGVASGKLASHTAAIFTFAILALLVIERPHIHTLIPGKTKNLDNFRIHIGDTAAILRATIGRNKLWLYMPDEDFHHFMSRIMLFELAPTPTTINRDFDYFEQPRNQILSEWAQYDFVWIANQDPQLDEKLRGLVGPDLGERLYKVSRESGDYKVELVRPAAANAK